MPLLLSDLQSLVDLSISEDAALFESLVMIFSCVAGCTVVDLFVLI
jgi:hypothetical protein